jgi:hypothetical protein
MISPAHGPTDTLPSTWPALGSGPDGAGVYTVAKSSHPAHRLFLVGSGGLFTI